MSSRLQSQAIAEGSKLLFVVAEDWYFWSHRLPIARVARDAGFEVLVATRVNSHGELIKNEGFTLIPLQLIRDSRNPWCEIKTILELVSVCRRECPDIIHLVALKPIIYGSIAAALAAPRAAVISAVAGMGYLGTSSSRKARLLRPIVALCLRWFFNSERAQVLVQNPEDAALIRSKLVRNPNRVTLIKGAGVDTSLFNPSEEPIGIPTVVLAARMLSNKGVLEFVEAATLLRRRGVSARLVLVGDTDPASPTAIMTSQLLKWNATGIVEWLGHSSDMPSVFRNANVVCLPSYREGLPKVLLEGMSSARAVVATDVPGCREVVTHGKNGLLVAPRDGAALANALELLIANPDMRKEMGKSGRKIACQQFSIELISQQTLSLYTELLCAAELSATSVA